MTTFEKCEQLKTERQCCSHEREQEIDSMIKRLEPFLSHEEAILIVQRYELGGARAEEQMSCEAITNHGGL